MPNIIPKPRDLVRYEKDGDEAIGWIVGVTCPFGEYLFDIRPQERQEVMRFSRRADANISLKKIIAIIGYYGGEETPAYQEGSPDLQDDTGDEENEFLSSEVHTSPPMHCMRG